MIDEEIRHLRHALEIEDQHVGRTAVKNSIEERELSVLNIGSRPARRPRRS